MTKLLFLFVMIFLHIFNDYNMQGILAQMKQHNWWLKHSAFAEKYTNDYKMALVEHAFSWSFTITLPYLWLAFTQHNSLLMAFLMLSYIFNTMIHAFIDNLKANEERINLVIDQLLHLGQIVVTWILMTMAI